VFFHTDSDRRGFVTDTSIQNGEFDSLMVSGFPAIWAELSWKSFKLL
jgi:hypothetical protein